MVAVGLVLAACGADAPSTLSADDLASKADSICKKATKAIAKLDPSDPTASLNDAIDLLSAASDDLAALTPSTAEQADYDDFTSSIAKQVKQSKKVATAAKGGDAAALTGAQDKMVALTTASDSLADGLSATKCIGLGLAVVGVAGIGTVDSTLPTTTWPADTVPPTVAPTMAPATTGAPLTLPPTLPPQTLPPGTVPPVTVPPATLAPDTVPAGTAIILNVMDDWKPPTGHEFQREPGDILGKIFESPDADPVLGPNFVTYAVGADLGPESEQFNMVFVLELRVDFADAEINSFITFHQADAGSAIESPGGHKYWVVPASGDITWDTTMAFLSQYGVVIRTEPGIDAVKIMDSFVANNFG